MKRKIILTIVFVAIAAVSYIGGATQSKTITETKEVIKTVETVPDGYIKLSECIPLEDVAYCFIDGYDYPCFELKDVVNQLDNPNNRSYTDIMQSMEDTTEDFKNNYVDMRQVADFTANGNSLQLYLKDGNGYYWER